MDWESSSKKMKTDEATSHDAAITIAVEKALAKTKEKHAREESDRQKKIERLEVENTTLKREVSWLNKAKIPELKEEIIMLKKEKARSGRENEGLLKSVRDLQEPLMGEVGLRLVKALSSISICVARF